MKKVLCIVALFVSIAISAHVQDETRKTGGQINRLTNADVSFQLPRFIFSHTNTRVIVKFADANNFKLTANDRVLNFIVNGTEQKIVFDEHGVGSFYYTFTNDNELTVLIEDISFSAHPAIISVWYITIPLLLIILFFTLRITMTLRKNKRGKLKLVKQESSTEVKEYVEHFKPLLKVVRVAEEAEAV